MRTLGKRKKTDSPLMYKFPTWLSTKTEDKFFFYDSTNSIRFIECQESKLKEVKMIPLKNHRIGPTSDWLIFLGKTCDWTKGEPIKVI